MPTQAGHNARGISAILALVATCLTGCTQGLAIPSQQEFVFLSAAEMARKGDEYLGVEVSERDLIGLIETMQIADLDPVYRGFLWQLVIMKTDWRFRHSHPELWFIDKDAIDAAIIHGAQCNRSIQSTVL